jgi:ketosteroid isomerase-like protein
MRFLFLLTSLAVAAFAANNPAEKAVRAALNQFNEAARKGDGPALEKLLSEDLVYVHSNANVENKAACIAALLKGKPDFQLADNVSVKVYGNTALVHGKMTANVVQNGAPARIQLDLMQVWVRQGKQWQMVGRHTARLP